MRHLLLAALTAIGLTGCAQSVDAPLSPTFGRAVAAMDTQIIPARVSDLPPESSGAVGAAAVGRYGADQAYKPVTEYTSNIGSAAAVSSGK